MTKRFEAIVICLFAVSLVGHDFGMIEANVDVVKWAQLAMEPDAGQEFETMADDTIDNPNEDSQQEDDPSESPAPEGSSIPEETENEEEDEQEPIQDRTQQRQFVLNMMADLPRNDPFYEYCTGRPDPGICTGNFTRFAFSTDQGECVPFAWGGCGGNLNNFERQGTCLEACLYAAQKRAIANAVKYKAMLQNREPPAQVQISKLLATASQTTAQPITI